MQCAFCATCEPELHESMNIDAKTFPSISTAKIFFIGRSHSLHSVYARIPRCPRSCKPVDSGSLIRAALKIEVGGGVDTGPLTTQAVEDLNIKGLKEQRIHSSTVGLVVVLLELVLH